MQGNLTPTAKGMQDLNNILYLVENGDEVKRRIRELNDAEKSCEDERLKLTKAKDLDNALKKARQRQDQAEDIVKHANQTAEVAVSTAKREAEKIKVEAIGKQNEVNAALTRARKDIADLNSQITVAKEELKQIETEAIQTQGRADKLLKQAQQTKREYVAKLKDLKERVKDI